MQRRSTTILAADIVAFSRLVGADEERAIAFQKTLRIEVVDPLSTVRFVAFQLSSVKDSAFVDKLINILRTSGVPES